MPRKTAFGHWKCSPNNRTRLVITDLRMPRTSGLGVLREIKARNLSCAVIVVTGHGGVREAVEAMRLGAHDFLTKPVDPQQLVSLVDRVLRERGIAPIASDEDGSDEDVNLCDPGHVPTAPEQHATGS